MMRNYTEFARINNLKQIREQKGLTQRVLASACLQNASEISKYERGERMPHYPVLRCLSRFLDVSIDEIYPEIKKLDERIDRLREVLVR